jgi:disulfide bond formation protein DsbB
VLTVASAHQRTNGIDKLTRVITQEKRRGLTLQRLYDAKAVFGDERIAMMSAKTATNSSIDQDAAPPSQDMHANNLWLLLFTTWLIALASTLGALFIGEVMGKTPCLLCWFQRAFMFPLAVILAVACYSGDAAVWRYGLPLAVVGLLIAAYHNLLFWGVIPEEIQPCTRTGPSCSSADLNIVGVIPIPLLSLGAFAALTVLFFIIRRRLAT